MKATAPRRKKRFLQRRKRTLDPSLIIDYKKPDILKRFVTDRGKIIPRRISGATAKQQRLICESVKRARFLSLIAYSTSHRPERGFSGEMSQATMPLAGRDFGRRFDGPRGDFRDRGDRGDFRSDRGAEREEEAGQSGDEE